MGAMGGLPGMANLGMGSANFMEMQQRMQSEVLGNPDMLRQIMDSPLTQSLMSNPEIMRSLIQANPQMQQVKRAAKSSLPVGEQGLHSPYRIKGITKNHRLE